MCKSVSGIYRININNKCYIGSAVNIKHRWMRHKTQLTNQTHHSILLQRAYNKYQTGITRSTLSRAVNGDGNIYSRHKKKSAIEYTVIGVS